MHSDEEKSSLEIKLFDTGEYKSSNMLVSNPWSPLLYADDHRAKLPELNRASGLNELAPRYSR